jgi:hypothetical protein
LINFNKAIRRRKFSKFSTFFKIFKNCQKLFKNSKSNYSWKSWKILGNFIFYWKISMRLRKFSIFSTIFKFSKTLKYCLYISGRHILENLWEILRNFIFYWKFSLLNIFDIIQNFQKLSKSLWISQEDLLFLKILENFKKNLNLFKNSNQAISLENSQYFRHFSEFSKTVKNSLNISGRFIILENLGKI